MAVVTAKGSRIMTGLTATPPTLADAGEGGGRVKVWVETVETTATDSQSSTYLLAYLPSNARILGASKVYWDDLGTTSATVDLGVYNISGSAITDDPDALNDGLAVTSSASNAGLVKDVANYGKRLYEYVNGQTTDPKCDLAIKAKIEDADISAAGTITLEVYYTYD